MDFKNYKARQGRAFRHLWQMKKFGKFCLLFGSVQPVSLRTLIQTLLSLFCLHDARLPNLFKQCALRLNTLHSNIFSYVCIICFVFV